MPKTPLETVEDIYRQIGDLLRDGHRPDSELIYDLEVVILEMRDDYAYEIAEERLGRVLDKITAYQHSVSELAGAGSVEAAIRQQQVIHDLLILAKHLEEILELEAVIQDDTEDTL